jgi:predicted PhzF superfamily epimerase YddE/YHI9
MAQETNELGGSIGHSVTATTAASTVCEQQKADGSAIGVGRSKERVKNQRPCVGRMLALPDVGRQEGEVTGKEHAAAMAEIDFAGHHRTQ